MNKKVTCSTPIAGMIVKILVAALLLYGSFQCTTKNKQGENDLTKPYSHATDSSIIKNNMAVHLYMTSPGDIDSLKKAIDLLDEALTLDSKYPVAYGNKAHFLNIMGKGKEAMAVIDEALRNLPDDPQLNFVKGVFCMKNESPELAEEYFHQSLAKYNEQLASNPEDFSLLLNRAFVVAFAESPEDSQQELAKLKNRYEKESNEYKQTESIIQLVLNINKDDFVKEFWNQ